MQAVSNSVCHIGKWCLSLQQPKDVVVQDPFFNPESRQFFNQVTEFLLEKAIQILDTDCLSVGWPMIDFLTPWIQSHYKMEELPPGVGEKILQIFDIVLKRMAYPEWCEIEVDPDDAQLDYSKYRDLFTVMLKNIGLIKPIRPQFLHRISQEIEQIQVPLTPVRRAEVSLLTITELH